MFGIMGLGAVQAVVETASVGLIPLFVLSLQSPDDILGHRRAGPWLAELGIVKANTLIMAAGLVLLGSYLTKSVLGVAVIWLQNRFSEVRQIAFSTRLLAAYLRSPYALHLQSNSSSMVRSVLGETGIMFSSFLVPAFAIVAESLTALLILILLLATQPVIAIVTATFFGASSYVFYRAIRRQISEYGATNQFHGRLALQWVTQALVGVKEVKLYGKDDFFLGVFAGHSGRSNRAANNHALITQLPRYFNELIAVLGMLIATFVLLSQGGSAVVATLAMFAVAATRIIPSLNRMVTAFSTARYGLPALESVIGDVTRLEALSAPMNSPGTPGAKLHFRELTFQGIEFAFEAEKFRLTVPHLTIERGRKVGFVGPSGSGKTTLIDLMTGLMKPEHGAVLVNGMDISNDPRTWQKGIGYISQSIYLLDDTIRRNVAFGVPDSEISDAAVLRALETARLGEFVAGLESGLDTAVGDRGVRLSGGQRQRIGIARALYLGPEVLILDEGTSALDTVTETQIVESISSLGPDKTVIVVAHRLSTVRDCDTIHFVKDGSIVASGTYDELGRDHAEFRQFLNPTGTGSPASGESGNSAVIPLVNTPALQQHP